MARRVQAPDGRVWVVRRRWLPRDSALMRLRARMAAGGRFWRRIGEYADAPFDFEAILLMLALLAAIALLAYLLVPLLLMAVELLLLVPVLVLARVLLRRPWEVEARCGEQVLVRRAPSLRAAGALAAETALRLRGGEPPEMIA